MKKLGVKFLFIDKEKFSFIKKMLFIIFKYNRVLVKKLVFSNSGIVRKIGVKFVLRKSLIELCKIK